MIVLADTEITDTWEVPISKIKLFLVMSFFLSGVNGLIFEIIFRRLLFLSIGVTHYSVGVVLTVFMAGLGIGSIIFGKKADKVKNSFRLYGILEIGIGFFGILLIGICRYLDLMYVFFTHLSGSPASKNIFIKIFMSAVLLFPMTTLMGGTLPVLGKVFLRPEDISGASLGFLYGINTLGGVTGTLGSTFILLGVLGTSLTMLIFSILSACIGIVAFYLAETAGKHLKKRHNPQAVSTRKPAGLKLHKLHVITLTAFFVSGFVGLSVEVYWIRILAYVVGSHGYAFGIILAAFLSGIGLGSLFISRLVDRVKSQTVWLGIFQVFVGISVLITSFLLFKVRGPAGFLIQKTWDSWQVFIVMQMLLLFFLLILPTFLMGSLFPFVMSILTGTYKTLGTSVGTAYSINTLGCIFGAFFSSFIFIQLAGISSSLKISIFLSILSGLVLFFFSHEKKPLRTAGLVGGFSALILVFILPVGGPLQHLGPNERLIFYKEANSATVSVREDDEGNRMLSINGLDEVPVDPSSLLTFRVLAHLPLLLHPDPKEVMVLSLGGAITTSSVATHDIRNIDAVELCPQVVQAAGYFDQWNRGVLNDPRLNIMIQDGRNFLLVTGRKYDIITADATHPWSADSWILYTDTFYMLVRSRLAEGGIFCQWVPLHYMAENDFKCILRTIRSVFPHLSVWYTGSYVVVLGSEKSIGVDIEALETRMKKSAVHEDLHSVGIDSPAVLFSLYLLSDDAIDRFVGNGPLNTDNRAYLEHSAARCFGRETTPENLFALKQAHESAYGRKNTGKYLRNTVVTQGVDVMSLLSPFLQARENMMMGRIQTYYGNFSQSLEYYKKALKLAPQDGISRIFFNDAVKTLSAHIATQGDGLRRTGDIKKALDAYSHAISLNPSEPRAHNGVGLLLYDEGKYPMALEQFEIALRDKPNQVQIRYNKVLTLLKLGDTDEAEKEIEKIESLERGMNIQVSKELRRYLIQTKLGKK